MEELSIMSYMHIIGGIVAGIISFLFTVQGLLPITNEMLGVLISLIIVYGLGKFAEKKFGRETISLGSWFMNGVVPFYFMWMAVWIILLNYVAI
ncbi:MAG: hypothetical protein BZ135_02020 [Methanosphaera sp. rholeuAM6]|nr:MAG: hypothetical protein BZ135_02020 [Methanosphaera sp. rholeuAM6]